MERGHATRTVAIGVVVAALAGPAVAQGSDESLRAVIARAQARLIKDEARVLKTTGQYLQDKDARPVRRAIRREVTDLDSLRAAVRREPPSSTDGARGKRLVLSGLRSISAGYRRLGIVLTDDDRAAAKIEAAKAVKAARRGRSRLLAGLRLLA